MILATAPMTNFKDLEKWWEIIFCVYTMISLNSPAFLALHQSHHIETESPKSNSVEFSTHHQWNHESGWKNVLNNLRLIVQPLLPEAKLEKIVQPSSSVFWVRSHRS